MKILSSKTLVQKIQFLEDEICDLISENQCLSMANDKLRQRELNLLAKLICGSKMQVKGIIKCIINESFKCKVYHPYGPYIYTNL